MGVGGGGGELKFRVNPGNEASDLLTTTLPILFY